MREVIIIGGPSKSGKTYSALTIARALPDSKFVACCPDDGISRLLEYEFQDVSNVRHELVTNWSEFYNFVSKLRQDVENKTLIDKDWVLIDGIDLIYDGVKFEFIHQVFSKDGLDTPWDALIDRARKEAPVLSPGQREGLNSQFSSLIFWLTRAMPCHLIATAETEVLDVRSRYESEDEIAFYKSMGAGFKYDGYRRVPRMFHTHVTVNRDQSGFYYTLWGDRGSRGDVPRGQRQRNDDFFVDYLMKVGWKI